MVPGREGVMVFLGILGIFCISYDTSEGERGTLETQESKRDTEAVPRVSFKNYHVHPLGPSTAL